MFTTSLIILTITVLLHLYLQFGTRSLGSSALALLPLYLALPIAYSVGITTLICSLLKA